MAAIVFLVVGLIFLGVATPTESAAAGTLGCFVLAAAYRRLSWSVIKKAVEGTLRVTVMMFMILTGSTAFSQILAFTGASTGLILFVMKSVAPKDTTMTDIYKAALPFLACDAVAMAAIMAFPALVLWLPGLM